MSEENDSLDLEQHILRRMSNEYLFVWHHFCSLVVLNGQPNQNISCYHKKGKQFLFSQKVPFTWYHCPQTQRHLPNQIHNQTTRCLFELLSPFRSSRRLLCLCSASQTAPPWLDPENYHFSIIIIIINIIIIIIPKQRCPGGILRIWSLDTYRHYGTTSIPSQQ